MKLCLYKKLSLHTFHQYIPSYVLHALCSVYKNVKETEKKYFPGCVGWLLMLYQTIV